MKRLRPPNLSLLSKDAVLQKARTVVDSDGDDEVDLDADDAPELDDDDELRGPKCTNGIHKHPRTLPILTLDSDGDEPEDDEDPMNMNVDDDDVDGDELTKGLRELDKLRKSVQKNLRLRPIRSSQRLPKVSLTPRLVDSPTSTSLTTNESNFNNATITTSSASPSPATGSFSASSSISFSSSSKSPSSPWNAVDSTSSTDETETDVDTDANTVDTDASIVSVSTTDTNISDEPPMSATSIISNYFTPLSESNPSPTALFITQPAQPFTPSPTLTTAPPPTLFEPPPSYSTPTPISLDELQSLLTAINPRPLLIDTRPPPAHLSVHIVDSVNLAIPSLLLKRTRKQKRSVTSTTFPTLHSLRQYITTDESLSVWDTLLSHNQQESIPSRWDGTVIVYDDTMDIANRDSPNSTSWAVAYILEPLLREFPTGRLCYLEGGFASAYARKEFAQYIVSGRSTVGSAFVGDGGRLTESNHSGSAASRRPNGVSLTLKKPPSHGLFQLDTQTASRSKPLPEIDLTSSATASPSESRHDFQGNGTSTSSPNLSPNLHGPSSNVSSPSPTRLHHLHVPTAPSTAFLTAHSSTYAMGEPPKSPRSPMPVMPSAMMASSPISPYINFNSKSNSNGSTPSTASSSSSSTRPSPSHLSTTPAGTPGSSGRNGKISVSIPGSFILDSSPSPPPSQSHPQLSFRKPLPPGASARRSSTLNLRKLGSKPPEKLPTSLNTAAPVVPEPQKPKLGLDIRSTHGLPRLDIKSAAAVSSLPRLDIKSTTRTKSAERLPKLSLRTTGIGGPSVKGRSATLSVPPSAIGDGGGFANNFGGGGGSGGRHHIGGDGGDGGHLGLGKMAWGSSTGGNGYGGHGNQAMRSPVDWSFLNAGFGKMAQSVSDGKGKEEDGSNDGDQDQGFDGRANANDNDIRERRRGRSRERGEDRLTPFYTPPHSPGTPKAPVFEGQANGFEHHRNGFPPSPKTARPDGSSPSGGFPPILPRVGITSYGDANSDLEYPKSPSHTEFPKSPMAGSFGLDPPLSAFGGSFPHRSSEYDLDHDPSSSDTDGPPTTEDPHPPFTVSTILPQFLFLGPEPWMPEHAEMLKAHGVKRILNLAIECDQDDHGLALGQTFEKYMKISMRDHVEEEGVVSKVREVCDILDDARLHSAPTFVHCKAGKSRSVTAIIAYLIHANHWTLSKAYAFVLERRKGISPNIGFVSELMTFEEEELGGKSVGVQPTGPGGAAGDTGGSNQAYHGVAGGRRGGHIRESLPPVFTTAGPISALEPLAGGLGGEAAEGAPMSAGSLAVGNVRAEVGQDMEIKDAQGRWRHARRAPVDEQTLQPMRRVSKAGLESSAYGV